MAKTKFSDNPGTPLNKLIKNIWLASLGDSFKKHSKIQRLCRRIYKLGLEDGERLTYQIRQSGIFDFMPETVITTSNSRTFKVKEDGTLTELEGAINGKDSG